MWKSYELLLRPGPDTADLLAVTPTAAPVHIPGRDESLRRSGFAVCDTQHLLQFIWQEFSGLLLRKQGTRMSP